MQTAREMLLFAPTHRTKPRGRITTVGQRSVQKKLDGGWNAGGDRESTVVLRSTSSTVNDVELDRPPRHDHFPNPHPFFRLQQILLAGARLRRWWEQQLRLVLMSSLLYCHPRQEASWCTYLAIEQGFVAIESHEALSTLPSLDLAAGGGGSLWWIESDHMTTGIMTSHSYTPTSPSRIPIPYTGESADDEKVAAQQKIH